MMSRFASTAALMAALFVVLGFSDGWASAARQSLGLAYGLTVMCLLMSATLAGSIQDLRTDRSIRVLAAVGFVLAFAHHFVLGARSLYYVSLLGVGCGVILGLGLRFGKSDAGRWLEKRERRVLWWLQKRIGLKGRREET